MTGNEIVHKKDCAMYLGMRGKHCSGWMFDTCEGCRMIKRKSDGWYRSMEDADYLHIKRRKNK